MGCHEEICTKKKVLIVKPASMNDLDEIENVVLNDTTEQPIRQHFSAALKNTNSGKEADYRQAIIEAIAAVELDAVAVSFPAGLTARPNCPSPPIPI